MTSIIELVFKDFAVWHSLSNLAVFPFSFSYYNDFLNFITLS